MNWNNEINLIMNSVGAVALMIVGYLIAAAKFYRERKEQCYAEVLTPIAKMAYKGEKPDEAVFSKTMIKLYLHGQRSVVRKVLVAVRRMVDPRRGDLSTALQVAVEAARRDIHRWWRFNERMRPDEFTHFYLHVRSGAGASVNRSDSLDFK